MPHYFYFLLAKIKIKIYDIIKWLKTTRPKNMLSHSQQANALLDAVAQPRDNHWICIAVSKREEVRKYELENSQLDLERHAVTLR